MKHTIKESPYFLHAGYGSYLAKFILGFGKLAVTLILFTATSAVGQQAPSTLWSTNIGGKPFAVDSQSNVYAVANNKVIVLNPLGSAIQTNSICPLPALAQRDAAGNFYFFGSFDGTQNFGGITLVGGWTNGPGYKPGWPTCFLAEYNSNSVLQWVISFGPQATRNVANDLVLNPDGSLTVGFNNAINGYIGLYSSSGSNIWQTTAWNNGVNPSGNYTKISALQGTNGAYLAYVGNAVSAGTYSATGVIKQLGSARCVGAGNYAEPLPGTNNDIILAGLTPPTPSQSPILTKWNAQGKEFSQVLNTSEPWQLATDAQGNLYIGWGTFLSQYNQNGLLIWNGSYGATVSSMIFDAQGNRYISRTDGSVAKLQADVVPAPTITTAPVGGKIFAGSNFTFNVTASGYPPLYYYWLYQSNASTSAVLLLAGTNNILVLSNTTSAQSGLYSVVVSNVAGTITSTPASLQIQSVAFFQGAQMLTNGSYHFANPPTLSIVSAFTNGEVYYTLDGSTPSFLSTPYTGSFVVSNSTTLNAIAYNADFSQSAYADAVTAIIPPQFVLTATTAGGGVINLSPSNSLYGSNTVVTATAVPASGFSFLYWQGAATGTNPSTAILMNQNRSLTAVFGTTLSTTVAGNGHVYLAPPGGLYPYGTTVRLEAVPLVGNYFGVWGNAASGTTNPLYFTITNSTPTISSLFQPLSANQSALTVVVLGNGKVSFSPAGNVFGTNQTVNITATPNAGQSFLYWSGDATGTANPLSVSMAQSRYIAAHFSGQSMAVANGNGLTPQGFQFKVTGDPQSVYQILTSSNLVIWQSAGYVTNSSGTTLFTDPSATNASAKYYRAVLTQ